MMKSAIFEAVDMVVQSEGRVARTLGALGMAAAVAAGGSHMISKTPGYEKPTATQTVNTKEVEVEPEDTQTTKPQQSGKIAYSDDFLNFIKQLENAGRSGWNSSEEKWYPHASPEGGRDTIAYGHKFQSDAEENQYASGITEQQAFDLLHRDLDIAWNRAASYVKSKHGVELETLSHKQQEMLTEYAFNLGSLNGFPKFTKAVVEEDWDTARKEYKRTYKDTAGKRRELARNKSFYDRYLKP
jgi:GH24 family phage-related lysozyme (muramidase)